MQPVDGLSRSPPPRQEAKPDESRAEKCQARGLGDIGVGAAICRETGSESPFGDRAGRRTGERADRRIRAVGIIQEDNASEVHRPIALVIWK